MSRSPELEILGVEDKVSCLDKSLKDLDLLPELESGNPGLTSSKETAREEAEEGPIQLLSDRQLIIFGLAQLVVFAAACAIILQTSFILPVIAKEFNKSDSETQWVAATFMLIWGCFQLIAGRLCDMFGRRRGYLLGCVTHIVFNVMSTFMPNLPSLNACRGLSGLSSAIMLPASSGLIGSLFPAGRKRTLAYVAITCGGAAGAASGEIVAGAFIRYNRWTWRPCFFTSGLIVLIPLVVGYKLIPIDPPISADWKVDWLGAFSIGSSLFLLLLTLTISQTADNGWKAPYLPALLVISATLFGLFVWRTMQLSTAALRPGNTKPPPIIPRGLLTWEHRNLLVIYIASLFAWAATDSVFVFISYLYFDILKMDPFEAGLKFSVTFFSGSSAGLLVAFTISRVSSRLLLSVCLAISVATSVIFALRETHWAYWQADLWAFLVVIYGTDATIAAGSTIISQTASPEDQSVAAGLFQTSCRLGFAVGLAIATQIRESVERAALSAGRSTDEATLKGLRAAFWTCSAFAATAALIIALGMEGWHKLDKHRSQKEDEEELQIGAREAT